jgi:hypothetical protein
MAQIGQQLAAMMLELRTAAVVALAHGMRSSLALVSAPDAMQVPRRAPGRVLEPSRRRSAPHIREQPLTLSMYQASVPAFRQGLAALSAILDKTEAQCAERKIDPAVLMADRLAPDMFAFTRQVQLACDFAKNGAARLAGREPPKFEDGEKTVAELKDRIARTLAYLDTTPASDIDGSEDRTITLNIAGQSMTFQGQPYLLHFALPNFYFHQTAAYAILRHNGIQIGKRDFIGGIPGM